MTLLAPTVGSLRHMLEICDKFARSYDVLFNSSKSKLLYFGSASHSVMPPIKFNGSVIETVKHDKHRGNIIGHNCTKPINDSKNTFNCKTNMVFSHFRQVDPYSLYSLFKTYCMPLYGSQIWDYDNTHIQSFFVAWRKAIRKILNLPNRTHCNLLAYIS